MIGALMYMNPSFDPNKALEKLITKPQQLICEALLDQHVLAGVGNKIKNEALFRRQVHPESLVGEIPKKDLQKLIQGLCGTQPRIPAMEKRRSGG